MIPCLRIVVLLAYCHCSLIFIAQRPEVPALDFLTGDQIQRDLDSLEAWILEIHPSPFIHCSSLDFELACKDSKEIFKGGGSLFAEAQMVARICNTLKDSHTGLSLRSFSNQLGETYGHLPLEVKTVSNQLRISKVLQRLKRDGSRSSIREWSSRSFHSRKFAPLGLPRG